jgi:hypothetical protein
VVVLSECTSVEIMVLRNVFSLIGEQNTAIIDLPMSFNFKEYFLINHIASQVLIPTSLKPSIKAIPIIVKPAANNPPCDFGLMDFPAL